MKISGKAELTALIHHIDRFSKSEIQSFNSEVPDTAGRKMRRTQAVPKRYAFYANPTKRRKSKRTQEIAKRYAFHDNAKMSLF